MEVYKFLPKVRGGAQRAEGSVVEGKLLYYCLFLTTNGHEFTLMPYGVELFHADGTDFRG